jgi:hypothetical protein
MKRREAVKVDEKTRRLKDRFETVAWGLLLILWGVTVLVDFVPLGLGILGTGVILLGLNGVRALKGQPTKGDTTVLGLTGLVWGVLDLERLALHLPFDLSIFGFFAIWLIILGSSLLARVCLQIRKTV